MLKWVGHVSRNAKDNCNNNNNTNTINIITLGKHHIGQIYLL